MGKDKSKEERVALKRRWDQRDPARFLLEPDKFVPTTLLDTPAASKWSRLFWEEKYGIGMRGLLGLAPVVGDPLGLVGTVYCVFDHHDALMKAYKTHLGNTDPGKLQEWQRFVKEKNMGFFWTGAGRFGLSLLVGEVPVLGDVAVSKANCFKIGYVMQLRTLELWRKWEKRENPDMMVGVSGKKFDPLKAAASLARLGKATTKTSSEKEASRYKVDWGEAYGNGPTKSSGSSRSGGIRKPRKAKTRR